MAVIDGRYQYWGTHARKMRGAGCTAPHPTCNAEGAGEPSPQRKRRVVSCFMAASGMKGGSGTVFFLVAHALRRSQFSPSESYFTSVPAPSERFSGRKFHNAEIFCRKPKGKRGDPQGRANFDEEGETFVGMVILSGVEGALPDNVCAC